MSDGPHQRLKNWLSATLESEEKFEKGLIGRILARDANGDYLVRDEQVPAHFFHTGANAANDIRAFVAAGGDVNVIENYAGSVLRSSGIIKTDSSADIDALDGWIKAHSGALSALPGLRQKLDNLIAVQFALRRAKEAHEEARVDFFSKPGALFLHNDPMAAVERLFALPLPAEAMRELIAQLRDDPQAVAGLQRAVVDYMRERVGVEIERHPAFCDFLDAHREALTLLFEEGTLATLDNISADLRRSALSLQLGSDASAAASTAIGAGKRSGWRRLFKRSRPLR